MLHISNILFTFVNAKEITPKSPIFRFKTSKHPFLITYIYVK